jgi:hypothetical protein
MLYRVGSHIDCYVDSQSSLLSLREYIVVEQNDRIRIKGGLCIDNMIIHTESIKR